MRECQVHPAVFIKIKRHHSHCRRQFLFRKINSREWGELPFPRIQKNGRARRPARNNKINRAVIVEVRRHHTRARRRHPQRGLSRDIRERAIPIVAPQQIVRRHARRARIRPHRDV